MSMTMTIPEAACTLPEIVRRARAERISTVLVERGEAVAEIRPVPVAAAPTGAELAADWSAAPHLTTDEAEAFAADLHAARLALPPVRSTWE